jgi:predicted TIM-barrel fold metal-dependent hydrolase
MIVDGHAHVWDTDFGRLETLLAQLDQAGIDRVLCVAGGTIDIRQFSRLFTGRIRPNPVVPNHLVYDALQRRGDRCFGLVYINPHEGAGAVKTLEDGFRHGCRGVKLSPQVHQFPFGLPVLDEVAEACGGRGFPVYTHVLLSPGSTTADFAALARRHPRTNFIIGHMGFGPADADAIDFAAELPNLYLESSLGNYLILCDALARLGRAKLIFGSEFPLSHPKVEIEKVRLLDPSCHDAVLGGNILRLIGVTAAS